MTAVSVTTPTAVGGNLTYTSVTDGVAVVPVIAGARYLLLWRNTGGSASVPTVDDPTSQSPVGATSFNPDLVGATVGATTGATAQLIDASRFKDSSGNVNIAMTNASGLSLAVVGPF